MRKLIILLLFIPFSAIAQNTFIAVIKNKDTKEPIRGATIQIKKLNLSAIADEAGSATLNNIPNGKISIEITCIGYIAAARSFTFPMKDIDTLQIFLEKGAQELDEVTVSTMRTKRSINNTPTRVEIIAGEEIHEEATMRPGDIKMLLSESTGVQAQQISAVTANASIRIQGLDGRYTQILKDGFPIYSGAASGLGLLQIPPIDLKQVEIIKGASSTLYGGGAIAGLVNLITKVPTDKKELSLHVNATSAGGLDVNGFYSKQVKKTGLTLFISRNSNKAYDPSSIPFSAIPKFERYTINPKLFLDFGEKTKLVFGLNTGFENRLGGDMEYIAGHRDSTHSYFERDKTKRISTQLTLSHQIDKVNNVVLKNSINYFSRIIESKGYRFDGTQYSTFSEATYSLKKEHSDWVTGLDILTDRFTELLLTSTPLRDYDQTTFGAFVQNTWNAAVWLTLETGFRSDYVKDYGFALLPRVSALFKIAPNLTSRFGGGFGYKPPTIFTEESEGLLYKGVMPISPTVNKFERSYGANWDVNYRVSFDEITFSINQLFFYTYLKNPLFLEPSVNNTHLFQNIAGEIISKGAETNIKLGHDEFALYIGYTYTDAKIYNNGTTVQNPLSPKHRFNSALVYETEGKWKIGSELYYFSSQALNDGSIGRDYWLEGLVAEKLWKIFSIYINFENIGNVRQTKFGSIYMGTVTNPVFKDIYAPLDGFVVNGGVKIKL